MVVVAVVVVVIVVVVLVVVVALAVRVKVLDAIVFLLVPIPVCVCLCTWVSACVLSSLWPMYASCSIPLISVNFWPWEGGETVQETTWSTRRLQLMISGTPLQ